MENIDTAVLYAEIKKLNIQLKNKSTVIKTKRKEGSYQLNNNGTARLQYMLDGERYSETVEAFDDEEAESKLALFVDSIKKGTFVNTNYTVSEFAQIWLDNKVKPNADIRVVDKYKGFLNKRILPEIGYIKIKKLNRQTLESFFNKQKDSKTMYKTRENKTISKETVEKLKSIINAMLNYAVECDIIFKNPCKGIKIIYKSQTNNLEQIKKNSEIAIEKINYFTIEEYKLVCNLLEQEFLSLYDNEKIEKYKKLKELARRLIVLLDLKTGMRRSELFGLAKGNGYYDLNEVNKTFHVNKSRHYAKGTGKYIKDTKNEYSNRIKSIPQSLVQYIKLYYNYLDTMNLDSIYIFDCLSIDGTSSWWDSWLKKHNIRDIKFHDIRHTHPTILLYLGVDMKTISERLGHADIQTTFNIYANVLKELDVKASQKIDKL